MQQPADTDADLRPLHQRISAAPVIHDPARAERALADLAQRAAADDALGNLGALIAVPSVRDLIAGILDASPYLASLIERDPLGLQRALTTVPEQRFAAIVAEMTGAVAAAPTTPDAMRLLRQFKAEVALLTALSDIGGVWPVMTATRRISEAADAAVSAAVGFLFRQAQAKGDWLAAQAGPGAAPGAAAEPSG
jgi:glutamate-ammonia-ligase adenylyltransferase